ncbi:GTPase [Pseudomonas savastanoi pv. glycinea]|nr:GTPase [Pseudomonas savastanoi pv. glycinea]RMU54757.1 GTPase [Pseudomonas savastanoi pv. glycinea]
MRQMANEAYGIGQHDRAQIIELQTTQGRIERGEQLVRRKHIRIGHRVEKGRFTGVGIPHQRNRRDIGATASTTCLIALAANLLQPPFDLPQANPQKTSVGFELGFAWAAQADTTFLTLKVSPATDQTRTHMLKLGQFDLKLAFVGTCALRKDIEDQTRTIKHAALENAFEVTFLTGREGVIEDNEISLFGLDLVAKLLDLARANQVFGRWPMTRHVDKRNGIGTGRYGQLLKLLRIFARLRVLTIQMNENCTLTTTVALKEQGRLLSGVTWLGVCAVSVGSAGKANRANRYDGGNGVFVDHLADSILQQNDELVERLDRALQLDTVDQVDRYPDLLFSQGIQVRVL